VSDPAPIGIDHLTVNGMPPLDFAKLAADAGCQSVGLFANRLDINPLGFPEWSLVKDRALRRDLRLMLDDLGLTVALAEGCAIKSLHDVAVCRPIIDSFAELRADRLNLISFEPDLSRDFDQMARFAEIAAEAGMEVCVEFSARPGRPPLEPFMARIARTGMANLSALIDAMHFFGAGCDPEDLSPYAATQFTHLQLCDIRWDDVADYMEAALHERLAPGDGALPLAALMSALPSSIAVSMELPQISRDAASLSPLRRLRAAADRSRELLASRTAEI